MTTTTTKKKKRKRTYLKLKMRSDPRPYEMVQDESVRVCLSDGFGYRRNSTTEDTEYYILALPLLPP